MMYKTSTCTSSDCAPPPRAQSSACKFISCCRIFCISLDIKSLLTCSTKKKKKRFKWNKLTTGPNTPNRLISCTRIHGTRNQINLTYLHLVGSEGIKYKKMHNKIIQQTYNRLILNIAGTICIFESVKTFLSIDVSRTDASWKKDHNYNNLEKHEKISNIIKGEIWIKGSKIQHLHTHDTTFRKTEKH